MKIIQEKKVARLSLKDTHDTVQEIFGENVSTDFDNQCIDKVEIVYTTGIASSVNVYYNKIKIMNQQNHIGYWPFQVHKEELNLEVGVKFIKELP